MNMDNPIIEIRGLQKSFGAVKAVQDLSLTVQRGELFAFLGVNGAGKSTTIHILCGELRKDGGSVCIDGYDVERDAAKIRGAVGVVFQGSVLDAALSVRENLESRAALYGITGEKFEERLRTLAEMLEFSSFLRRPVGKLSGGQRRRIDVARALLQEPRLLILDEPTTGLDPQTRRRLWEVVEHLRIKTGMTVFLTTHYMEEAADADHVVILDGGRLVAEGTPLSLKNTYSGDFISLYGVTKEEVDRLETPYVALRDGYRLAVRDTAAATALILRHPDVFRDYEITKGHMDDVFLAVTGKHLTQEEGK